MALDQPDRVRAAASWAAPRPTAWEIAITTVERDLAAPRLDLPPLFYATQTLRYLPIADIQNTELVEHLAVLHGLTCPSWPNPGRLGQYEAALAWSTDPVRTTRWPEIAVPCLVLAFEHDVDSPPEYARRRRRPSRQCRYVEIAGSGHIGIVTHPNEVAHHLIEFFSTV